MTTLTIGQLASTCNVSIDTIRYYERKNVLVTHTRTNSGYRLYSQDSVTQLNFIRSAQSLGFTLSEISELLDLSSSQDADCGDIRIKAKQKIKEIEIKINTLETIKNALQSLANTCPGAGKPLSDCSILQHLVNGN